MDRQGLIASTRTEHMARRQKRWKQIATIKNELKNHGAHAYK